MVITEMRYKADQQDELINQGKERFESLPHPNQLIAVTFGQLYTAHLRNLMYPSFNSLITYGHNKEACWLAIVGAFYNSKDLVHHLTSPYYFTKEIATVILKTLDYLCGYRALLVRVNLYLAALVAKEPFDFADLCIEKTGRVFPTGLKDTYPDEEEIGPNLKQNLGFRL